MVTFPGDESLPSLGLGTWRMGESKARRRAEVAAVRSAIEMGWRVIDTAEMYGDGGAEEVVGAALAEAFRSGGVTREELFIVSKVYPHNASARGSVAACQRSLARLGLDRLDAYLLHWRGNIALQETVDAFEELRTRSRIRHWGVSNFDRADLEALGRTRGGERCAANQIYYSLGSRGPAFDLVPWQQARGIATMAYSPLDQGDLAQSGALAAIANRLSATPAQLALAWLTAQSGVMAIPKASSELHLRENLDSRQLHLGAAELADIDAAFAPPRRKTPLAMR